MSALDNMIARLKTVNARGARGIATRGPLSDVVQKVANTGVLRKYNNLTGAASALPFGKPGALDINHYVVSKSLDGLFYVLGQEEAKIRKNPAAQITPLLRQVFGR